MQRMTPKTRKVSCVECSADFYSFQVNVKTCSEYCRKALNKKYAGTPNNTGDQLPTGTVGAISELVISTDLMRKGYSVFRALSQSCFCDLICIKDGKFIRVEARTGYRTYINTLNFPKKAHGEIDMFAINKQKTNEIVYLQPDASTPYEL